jgi:hypothetical protein
VLVVHDESVLVPASANVKVMRTVRDASPEVLKFH